MSAVQLGRPAGASSRRRPRRWPRRRVDQGSVAEAGVDRVVVEHDGRCGVQQAASRPAADSLAASKVITTSGRAAALAAPAAPGRAGRRTARAARTAPGRSPARARRRAGAGRARQPSMLPSASPSGLTWQTSRMRGRPRRQVANARRPPRPTEPRRSRRRHAAWPRRRRRSSFVLVGPPRLLVLQPVRLGVTGVLRRPRRALDLLVALRAPRPAGRRCA